MVGSRPGQHAAMGGRVSGNAVAETVLWKLSLEPLLKDKPPKRVKKGQVLGVLPGYHQKKQKQTHPGGRLSSSDSQDSQR